MLTACGELRDFFAGCRDGSVRLMKIGIIEGFCSNCVVISPSIDVQMLNACNHMLIG